MKEFFTILLLFIVFIALFVFFLWLNASPPSGHFHQTSAILERGNILRTSFVALAAAALVALAYFLLRWGIQRFSPKKSRPGNTSGKPGTGKKKPL